MVLSLSLGTGRPDKKKEKVGMKKGYIKLRYPAKFLAPKHHDLAGSIIYSPRFTKMTDFRKARSAACVIEIKYVRGCVDVVHI